LLSVQKAIKYSSTEAEIIVIDNNSHDRSVEFLQPQFSQVHFISNKENIGFARACNQGYRISKGHILLFLNPDTIIPEDCLKKCLDFFHAHPDAGAIGIRMLDGSGRFLKESKRSFPSPVTSLYKLFGLTRLFPRSKIFAKYHLGHLNENENHVVDVLAGAFMMIRREVFDIIGSFDEIFFMYGEDVDLSYRIQKGGFKNYYIAETSLVHFKGESTKKGSLVYVRMFYNAMSIFVRKHYGGGKARLFNFLIHVAIWIRAGFSALSRFIQRVGLPLLDAILILISFWLMKKFWNEYVTTSVVYPNRLLWISFSLFTIIYLVVAYYAGLYDKRYRRWKVFRSTLIATIVLLAVYSLMPERYRFSRAIILFGAFLAFLLMSILRWLLIQLGLLQYNNDELQAHTLIVGSADEYETVIQLLKEAGLNEKVLGRVAINEHDTGGIGHWKKLNLLFQTIPFNEVIFCEGNLSFREIIQTIEDLPDNIKIKFHAHNSHAIVGSDSKDTIGEILAEENTYKLADPYRRRVKRFIDLAFSLFFLLTFPVHFFTISKPSSFFNNCFNVLIARKTWIGYSTATQNLPVLRKGVLAPNGLPLSLQHKLPQESLQVIDRWYARDYEPVNDIKLLFRGYRRLGE
jgi:GT2 family glycosyltransferase